MESLYLDNAATTKVDKAVAEAVRQVMTEDFGNASSLHSVGKKARERLEWARDKIAGYLGCDSSEIIFTSGGTESNNIAIRGLTLANPEKKHIITSVIEHPSVLEICKDLEAQGYEVDYLGVDEDGLVSMDEVREKIREDTLVVSVMHVNNEIGVIQDVDEIGRICKKRGVYFHTDNVQGFLKEELALAGVDLMSVSGHKVHGPKGIGILYVRDGVKIRGIFGGGGHERGLRSGTENVPGAVGIAMATDINFKIDEVRWSRDKIMSELERIEGVKINGHREQRIYNNVSVSFFGIEGEALMMMLDAPLDNGDQTGQADSLSIQVSTGSACASSKLGVSHVLKAIGVDEMYINGSLRISLGADVLGREDEVVDKIAKCVGKLREMSPFKMEEKDGEDK